MKKKKNILGDYCVIKSVNIIHWKNTPGTESRDYLHINSLRDVKQKRKQCFMMMHMFNLLNANKSGVNINLLNKETSLKYCTM